MSKRYFILSLILLCSISAFSQNNQSKSSKSLPQCVQRLLHLQDAGNAGTGLYTYSLSWVHLQSIEQNKGVLRDILLHEIPSLKEQKKFFPGDVELDSVELEIGKITKLAEKIVMSLQTFEDYENPEKVEKARQELEKKMEPACKRFDRMIARYIANEEKVLRSFIANPSKTVNVNSMDELTRVYGSLCSKFQFYRLTHKLYQGTFHWLYRPIEQKAWRDELIAALKTNVDIGNDKELIDASDLARIEKIAIADVTVRNLISEVTRNLNTKEAYDDPTLMFLYESSLDSDITPSFQTIELELGKVILSQLSVISDIMTTSVIRNDASLKEIKGQPSKVTENRVTGIADTTVFFVEGKITRTIGTGKNKVLKGTLITLTNSKNGKVISVATDEAGVYRISGPMGSYDMEITCPGFERILIKKLTLGSGEMRILQAHLGPGTYYEMQ